MKVLILNYELPPLGGGTGIANLHLLREFSKQKKLHIDVVTSSANDYKEKAFSANIKIYYLDIGKTGKNLHHQSPLNLIRYFIKSTLHVFKFRKEYDLIHALSGIPGGITALLSGKPYIISLRGSDVPGYEARYRLLYCLITPLIRKSWKKAKSVDANSQYLKKLAQEAESDLKIKVIPNGIDAKIFSPAKKLVQKKQIVCSSRLGKRKGIEYLIKAMPRVLKTLPETKLVLIGEGVEKDELVNLTKQLGLNRQIIFKGQVEHKKLPLIYHQSSLFVSPSLSESLSNSLLEALAAGLPVVATKVGGNPELVNTKNGLLVPPANSQRLAKAIIKLLTQPALRKKLGQASRQTVKQHTWSKTAKEYIRLYEKTFKQT